MVQIASGALLETALNCVDDFYARLFRDWPEAVVRRVGDCTLSYSGNPRLNGANHLFPHTPDALTGAVLAEAEAFFAGYDAVWTVIFADRYMPHGEALFSERRYSPRWHSPLMVLDDLSLAPGEPPPFQPCVVRASTPEHLDDIIRVLRDAFGTSSTISRRVVRDEHLTDPAAGVWHYLAYNGRTATACAMVALHASAMATVWNVGTRPFYRRRGVATAIMHAILADLHAAGLEACALLSSDEGVALYERLGYRTLAQVYYMGPPPAFGAWLD